MHCRVRTFTAKEIRLDFVSNWLVTKVRGRIKDIPPVQQRLVYCSKEVYFPLPSAPPLWTYRWHRFESNDKKFVTSLIARTCPPSHMDPTRTRRPTRWVSDLSPPLLLLAFSSQLSLTQMMCAGAAEVHANSVGRGCSRSPQGGRSEYRRLPQWRKENRLSPRTQ